MPRGGSSKARTNESRYPYIVELPGGVRALDVALNRRMIQFHKTRALAPRHGRTIEKKGHFYYRWCFSDLATAHAFIEEVGGSLIEPERG